ncbi:MAG: hypothetical protein MZV64_43220 [Ignavibacteriales bacterium]|nr:hypothetical protein [Ignavibacteriales bacterium]
MSPAVLLPVGIRRGHGRGCRAARRTRHRRRRGRRRSGHTRGGSVDVGGPAARTDRAGDRARGGAMGAVGGVDGRGCGGGVAADGVGGAGRARVRGPAVLKEMTAEAGRPDTYGDDDDGKTGSDGGRVGGALVHRALPAR